MNARSFMYGPPATSIEQINNTTGTVVYLHHDQQGFTRLITGSTGKEEGKCSYSAYGTPDCEGTAATPLGWDAQYTSSDTGLIYLRNRVYDPTTAQFLTVDPLEAITGQPYSYADDNPVNKADPSGLIFGIPGTPSTSEVLKVISHVAGGVAVVGSIAAAGCSVVAAPTVVGEAVCGVAATGALAAGAVATAADTYLAATGAQSPGPAIFDALGLGTGVGGEVFEGALGDEELGAYAKTYGALLSAAAYGEAFAESAFGCG